MKREYTISKQDTVAGVGIKMDTHKDVENVPNGDGSPAPDDIQKRLSGEPESPCHEELSHDATGWLESRLNKLTGSTETFLKSNTSSIKTISIFVLNGLVIGYFFGCMYYWIMHVNAPLAICEGFGSLIAFLGIIYFFLFYFLVFKRYFGRPFRRIVVAPLKGSLDNVFKYRVAKIVLVVAILGAAAIFLYFDTKDNPDRLISLLGLLVFLLLGFLFSAHPGRVNWTTVGSGLLLQVLLGLLVIRWEPGRLALQCFADKVATFLSYGLEGARFVFGDRMVIDEGVFAFSTLPIIFFFSMLVEVMFYWGAIQWFCLKLGSVIRIFCRTTVAESVIAVGNVFLGMTLPIIFFFSMLVEVLFFLGAVQWFCLKLGYVLRSVCRTTVVESVMACGNVFLGNTESVLIIKPYVRLLTESEVHAVMASGFATVSGTILAAYIGFGAEPVHLVTASVMSAPAALCYAKLMLPETKKSLTAVDNLVPVKSEDQSALSAATRGATNGISLVLNIIANLVAFVSFVAFVNGFLGYVGGMLGFGQLSLEWIMSKVFIPISWIMGVPWDECEIVATLIGLKTVVNEFVAYQRMGEFKRAGQLSPRAEAIATYALCGFTNPSSAGIMIGAYAAIAPNQRETLSKVALRAFFAGCGICFMTACIAGILLPDDSFGSTMRKNMTLSLNSTAI